mmetsp:Transcript_7176/g.10653  ORF Transcript_7176/g.10653 Transcript_7176/m.10653 type:complete len:188 (+) Transcript_7176:73-636(+)|eukprot:scaffold15316_cov114-Skeletonema_dohrnii-CCMP3373.AAC.2
MATNDPKLQPLHKTLHALKEIRSSLLPFLKLLRDDDDVKKTADEKKKKDGSSNISSSSKNKTTPLKQQLTPHKRAEAEAAVALAMGTLRYMGGRLKGLDRGRKKGDPLRKELDQIRGLLVSLRKIESEEEKKLKNDSSPKTEDSKTTKEAADTTSPDNNKSKRRSDNDAEDVASSSKKKKKKQKTSK